jgi:dihydroorotate dehydrogenase
MDTYDFAGPLIRLLDAERAHRLAVTALRSGLMPRAQLQADPMLAVSLWGRRFPNPIGLAAGFDKNAEVIDAMLGCGFGFVEIGTVTPRPQAGNPRPRLFRLTDDRAVINRMGFNNDGLAVVARRLAKRRARGAQGIIGGNVGPNRDADDPAAACAEAAAVLAPLVDYLVINVSSPNTPGLRALQAASVLADLLARVRGARDSADPATPLLVKVAPDLSEEECADIARVVLDAGIDGLIATNTTVERPAGLRSRQRGEAGGLSGAPLFARSTDVLKRFRRLTGGRLPLIGVGGITSGADAYAKVRAGASLVQLYTALVWHGPALVGRIASELAALLRRDGFSTIGDAVGADADGGGNDRLRAGTAP